MLPLQRVIKVRQVAAGPERRLEIVGRSNFQDTDAVTATLAELHETGIVSYLDEGTERLYTISPDQHLNAAYYRNTMIHFLTTGAIGELALLRAQQRGQLRAGGIDRGRGPAAGIRTGSVSIAIDTGAGGAVLVDGKVVGSTVACLLALPGHCLCMWAGDSRVYRLRDFELEELTTDHSEVEEMIAAAKEEIKRVEELGEAALEFHLADDVLHLGADARHLAQADLVNLVGGHVRRRVVTQHVVVERLALGQRPGADRAAAGLLELL